MFIDTAKITLQAGNGGNGLVSFRREKYVAAGGPDGGDGGRGGDIILEADERLTTLLDFRYKTKYVAQNGEDGRAQKSTGKSGESLIVKIPPGTIIKDAESGLTLADMTISGQRVVMARGGNGGWGNTHFATPTRQAPKFAKNGLTGQSREIILELKLLADVGLIGFPNVGKSTLISRVSEARPKIANYHFTTLEPNLGVVNVGEMRSFVMADIPGLIEGAHQGIGLGHEFLRHIERTRLLVHLVDVSGIEGRNPIEDFHVINRELKLYNAALADRPQLVAANKVDLAADSSTYEDFLRQVGEEGYEVFEISAATGSGVRELILRVSSLLDSLPPAPVFEPEQDIEMAPEDTEAYDIHRENNTYVVDGPWVHRLLGRVNFEDNESLGYFQRSLVKKGVIDALRKRGINQGDTVRIGSLEFDFID